MFIGCFSGQKHLCVCVCVGGGGGGSLLGHNTHSHLLAISSKTKRGHKVKQVLVIITCWEWTGILLVCQRLCYTTPDRMSSECNYWPLELLVLFGGPSRSHPGCPSWTELSMAGFQTTRHASTQTFSRREKSFRLSLIRAKRVYAVLHYVTGSLMSVCSLCTIWLAVWWVYAVLHYVTGSLMTQTETEQGRGPPSAFVGILCWVSV